MPELPNPALLTLLDCDANVVETFAASGDGYETALARLNFWVRFAYDGMVEERARRVWDGALEEGDSAYFLGVEAGPQDSFLVLRACVRGGNVVVEPVLRACKRIIRGHALP